MSVLINNNIIKNIYIKQNQLQEITKGYIKLNGNLELFYNNNIPKLPNGYTEVEYIQKNAPGSYINTGVLGIKPMKIELGVNNTDTGVKEVFGFLSNETSLINNFAYISAIYFNSDYLVYYYYDRSEETLNNRILIEKDKFYNIEYDFDYNSHNFNFKDLNNKPYREISINYNQESYFINNENPLLLFGYYNTTYQTINSLNAGLMIKRVKIYDTLRINLLRNFIPCINPNFKVGLYDLVTKTFYENSGSGSFGAGPIVQH